MSKTAETKWAAYDYGQFRLVNRCWVLHQLSQVAPGSLYNQRVGEYLTPKYLEVRLALSAGIPPGASLRLIIFKRKDRTYVPNGDTQSAWAAGPSNQYVVADPATGSMSSNFNPFTSSFESYYLDTTRKGDLQVVMDRKFQLGSDAQGTFKTLKVYPKVAGKMHYAPGSSEADTAYYMAWTFFSERVARGGVIGPDGNQIISTAEPTLVAPTTVPGVRISSIFKYIDI